MQSRALILLTTFGGLGVLSGIGYYFYKNLKELKAGLVCGQKCPYQTVSFKEFCAALEKNRKYTYLMKASQKSVSEDNYRYLIIPDTQVKTKTFNTIFFELPKTNSSKINFRIIQASKPYKIEKNLVITVPLIIAMIVCLLYLVFINGRFINDLLEVRTTYEQEQVPYDEIENMFKTLSIHIHLLGVICYIITTILSLLIIYGANFNCSFYVLFGVGIGVGIVWNLRGYFGDMRIDWKKLCKKTVKYIYEDKYDHIRQQKLRYTINHIVINISSIIIMVFAYLFFAMKTIKFPFNISELEIGKNEFFIVAFIIILIYYIKILYPLYYIQGNSIYYDFKDLFINENNEKI